MSVVQIYLSLNINKYGSKISVFTVEKVSLILAQDERWQHTLHMLVYIKLY